ncbi:MAG: sulfur carrier protein ThiS [Bacteroidetes bacterium]|nr:sulfur carrier protein ThiS [Bacteroidota bacterium]MBU1717811.1 sulfur carrier protein ThiS [Bacteroidota bacterium]
MKIILNNREEEFAGSSMTIRQLLDEKQFAFRMLVIKVNGVLIKKEEYATATIKDGDTVIVLHLMSGG